MKKIFLFVLFSWGVVMAYPQQQNSLLKKYRSMALDYNHDLKAAERNITASIEFEKMARADLKPKLAAGANFQYTGNPTELNVSIPALGAPLSFEGKNVNYGAAVSLLQPIYTGGRLLEAIRIAGHQQSLASAGAEVIRSAVCFQTDVQYWNVVARYEMVDIATDFRNSVASLVGIIKDRVEVGMVDPQDLLMAEVKLNEADYQLLQAKSNFETGRMALNSIIGLDLHSDTEIEQNIPAVLLPDSLLLSGGDRRAEIRMAQDNIKIAESVLKLNDSKYKPQFYVGADGSYSSPGYDFHSDLSPNYAVYAKLSVPVFEWGKRRREKRVSSEQVGMAADNLGKVTDHVNLEVQTARVALTQAMQRVELSSSSLGKAIENERKALERYSEGKVSILEVIDAQTYRQTSQVNCTQAKVAAQGHYSELIKALNGYDYQ